MDRQVKAELAWQIPFKLQERLGTFRFRALAALSYNDITTAFARPAPLHRFTATMAKCFFEAICHIGDAYGGNASKIWSGKPSSAVVVYRFLQFHGIGPKIATMAVNILARNFKIKFADYYSVDISADAQVRRVFERLNLTPKARRSRKSSTKQGRSTLSFLVCLIFQHGKSAATGVGRDIQTARRAT
ncbi:MAG TPA: hypothetical protein VI750_14850 [Pyrinomonadaceae bacterium]|nr:hypothetical protein [Pyrinomonadaceae bacterium]